MSEFTQHQKDDFERKARRLIEWLNINCHPHMHIIITHTNAELVEGQVSVYTEDFLRD